MRGQGSFGSVLRRSRVVAAIVFASLIVVASASQALAAGGPEWRISVVSEPTNLPAGSKGDEYVVTAINTGGASTDGSTVKIVDSLPTGLTATSVSGVDLGKAVGFEFTPLSCEPAALECSYTGKVTPGEVLRMVVAVEVAASPGPSVTNIATVSGGGAAEASTSEETAISALPAPFGVVQHSFQEVVSTGQAGAHPNLTTSFALNQKEVGVSSGSVKEIDLELPPGLIGNSTATSRCTVNDVLAEKCASSAAVGVATVSTEIETYVVLVYNVKPEANEPAAFAFSLGGLANVRLDTRVRSDGDYGIHVSITDVSQAAPLVSSSVTLWGVPAAHNGRGPNTATEVFHNPETGEAEFVTYGGAGNDVPVPLLTNPTSCVGPSTVELSLASWPEVGVSFTDAGSSAIPSATSGFTGCEKLRFEPSMSARPDTFERSAPAGYEVDLHIPQNEDPEGLATPDVRDVHVTLPEGTVISPSAANGLTACTEAQFGLHSGRAGECPRASTLGTVKITTPLLQLPVEGHVFVGEPECSPCTPADAQDGKMVPLLLEVEGSGVIVKLAGQTSINQGNGQLTTTFRENPQLPFSDLELSLKGGEDAPVVNPRVCGPAIATARLTPWSTLTATEVSAPPIPITGCSTPGFGPSLRAGMTTTAQAGAFSGFSVTLSRPDGQQDLRSVTVSTPPGLAGMVSKVALCGEAEANAGTCPASSQIGTSWTTLGPGTEPLTITGGKVYLTGPYGGGPFGLSIVMPAEAGPFKLAGTTGAGAVVVRASIAIDPRTSVITIASGELPTQLDGIPLDIRTVNVDVNREGFMFNPTNCNAMSIGGVVMSTSGTVANVSYPFQAANCANLPFKPSFSALTHANPSRNDGAYLHVVVKSGAGQANVGSVKVQLPKSLPARLSTLKLACTEAQFAADPAGCPAGSKVGSATAYTPVLPVALTGPAYFVSHGGAKFPELVLVLQGDGVTLDLAGETFISSKGITSSTFRSVPDVPITRFDLVLPAGAHSALAGNGSFCTGTMYMPTQIKGQNGAVVKQNTKVAVTGCKPAVTVVRSSVKGAKATIVASVPSAGRLVASGKGLSRVTRRLGKAGTTTVTLTLSKQDQLVLAQHPGRRLKVSVKLLFTPTHGSRLSASVTLLMG